MKNYLFHKISFKSLVILIIFTLVLVYFSIITKFIQVQARMDVMPPEGRIIGDDQVETYIYYNDADGTVPGHAFDPRDSSIGTGPGGELETAYFSWSAQDTSNELPPLPEYEFPTLRYPSNFDVYSVYQGGSLSMEPSEFIFLYPWDSINVFGGGRIPYENFYFSSYTQSGQPPGGGGQMFSDD